MNRRLITAGLCAAALASAACGTSDNGTAASSRPNVPPPSTVSEPADPVSSPPVETNDFPPSPTSETEVEDTSCLTADSAVVQDAVSALAPPNGRDFWYIDKVGQKPYPGCQELQWVQVATPGGTASSGYHVLFFHDNEFVSTANTFPTAYTRVVGETDDSVSIEYLWLDDDDASCCPQGGPAVITYTWDGTAVGQDQPLPEAMIESYSH